MLRLLGGLLLLPALGVLGYLAFSPVGERAEFVVASDSLRTVDPQRVSWLDEIQAVGAMFEGLTRTHPLTHLPEPGVALRWERDSSGSVYTFYLRPDARWSNGELVTAEHFRFAWLRALDPEVEAQYASLLFVIEGAEDYYRCRLDDDSDNDVSAERVGVRVIDAHTLRVALAGPCSYFLDLTAFPTYAPVYPPVLQQFAGRDGGTARGARHLWARPGTIVCNGAFVLERWDFKRRLLLRRNPYYWDADEIDLESIELYITADTGSALIGYETGRIDFVRGLQPEIARSLQEDGRTDLHVGDRFATYFLRVNCKRPPLDNADLRIALSLAVDKQALCEFVLGLGETPADTYVPRGALSLMPRAGADAQLVYYEPPAGLAVGLRYDERLELAGEYLRRSGFDGSGRALELAFAPDPAIQRRISEALQGMWERGLGIRVELLSQERNVLSSRIRALDYDLVRSDWYGDYMDPATFLEMYVGASGQNRTGWENAEYDRLIGAASREADNVRRFDLFRQAERILCEQELPIIPLYFKRGNFLLSPRFGGVSDNVRDILPIHRVRGNEQYPTGNAQ